MNLVRRKEHVYIKKHLREVKHITLDPNGPGVVRVHMIPTDTTWKRYVPYILILNGQYILPIGLSWAIMLDCFISVLSEFDGKKSIPKADWDKAIDKAVTMTRKVYPAMRKSDIGKEMELLTNTIKDVAYGNIPKGKLSVMTIGEYAQHMLAPHRMDLMVSAMTRDGLWHCNQKCLHCYAAGQSGAEVRELSTSEWKRVIDICRRANIPQITFTGGEPTMREDLVELIRYSSWFVTRLNTNGRKLTPELCRELTDASLDNVQITLYSHDRDIHDKLVGADGFEDTVNGIKAAVGAGLSCSVNTPLCTLNKDYTKTLKFIKSLGVNYVTCSGLIPSGNALNESSTSTALSGEEMKELLLSAVEFCAENGMEISFTSPGWLSENTLRQIGLKEIPSCGACLSNMAVRPDGEVVPCQSWLSGVTFGNILKKPWRKIWDSPECKKIREKSALTEYKCQLRNLGREENGK